MFRCVRASFPPTLITNVQGLDTLGIAVSVEDTSGGDIITAAIAHLAHSRPPEFMLLASDVPRRVGVGIAEGAPKVENARMSASTIPGLGVSPRMEVLGEPTIDVR